MKILVVGGNGFIGSHLVDRIVGRRWDVTVLDLHDRAFNGLPPEVRFIEAGLSNVDLEELVSGLDAVVHLAWSSIHEVSNRDPAADVQANLVPTLELIGACARQKVKRFVFTSSGGTVYGPARSLPIGEDHPKNPLSAYGINKLSVEKYLHMYHELHGLDYAVLRPSVPYGPRQNPLGRQGAVAVFLYRIARGLPLEIWGDGSVSRDYFYVGDLADALLRTIEADLDDERVFNIAGDREISLRELVGLVEVTVGKKAVVQYLSGRKFDAPRLALDTARAHRVLGWSPKVEIAEGLDRTRRWQSETL